MKILILKPSSGVAAEVDMEDTQGDVDEHEDIDTDSANDNHDLINENDSKVLHAVNI